jgi:hypothetical protein
MKEKVMLISGCSHAAGSEIDGKLDSDFNRNNSFGNLLASMLGRRPINISSPGSANPTIARSVLEWLHKEYDVSTMDLFICVAWTESIRMEIPSELGTKYIISETNSWFGNTNNVFYRLNPGFNGNADWEKRIIPFYQKFMASNQSYLEIQSLNLAHQMQSYFKSMDIPYVMCNTMHFAKRDRWTDFYLKLIDGSRYMDFDNSYNAFYPKYVREGHQNSLAQYWHHGGKPHELYAKELYKFITW